MADQKIQLTVQVNADTGQLEVLGAKFNETSQKAKETTNAFGDLGEEAGNLIKRFLPFATGAGLLTFFVSAVKGAEEQNEAFRRLQFTLENSGKSWEANREGIEKWTNAVAISTRFSGNEAIATLEKFTRITGSLTQATAASQLAMGLSVKSHKELSETVGLVTDLLNGNERALIGVKREFASVAGGATTTQEALSRLQTAYGNAAKSTGTLTDEGASLSHSFDQLKDSVGNVFGPVLIWLADKLKMVIKGYQELGVVIAGIGAALTVNIGPGFKAAMTAILDETTNSIQEI